MIIRATVLFRRYVATARLHSALSADGARWPEPRVSYCTRLSANAARTQYAAHRLIAVLRRIDTLTTAQSGARVGA